VSGKLEVAVVNGGASISATIDERVLRDRQRRHRDQAKAAVVDETHQWHMHWHTRLLDGAETSAQSDKGNEKRNRKVKGIVKEMRKEIGKEMRLKETNKRRTL